MTTFDRRTLLLAGTGATALVLTACTAPEPQPQTSPTPTRSATPEPTPEDLAPRATSLLRSSWADDQFARGSHSVTTVGSTSAHREALGVSVGDRIFFAGEATSPEAPSSVSGARQSGERAAGELRLRSNPGERVIVVGAGIAAAAVAMDLASTDLDVTVIEARDRIGGRVHTVIADPWPIPVELGAWLLQEVIDEELLGDLRLGGVGSALMGSVSYTESSDAGSPPESAGAEAAVPAETALSSAAAWATEQPADLDIATALTDSGAASSVPDVDGLAGDALLAHRLRELAMTRGVDAAELSAWYGLGAATGLDGRRAVTGDFAGFITESLSSAEVFLSTTVTAIAYDDEGVSLRLGTGESVSADRVVVTVPLGVLKADAIEFSPLLPFEHRTAIEALGVGTVDTIWMRFDEPFWSTDATVWHIVGTDGDLTVWFNLEPITGDPTLVALVGGEAAARVAALSDDELREAAQEALAPFLAS